MLRGKLKEQEVNGKRICLSVYPKDVGEKRLSVGSSGEFFHEVFFVGGSNAAKDTFLRNLLVEFSISSCSFLPLNSCSNVVFGICPFKNGRLPS